MSAALNEKKKSKTLSSSMAFEPARIKPKHIHVIRAHTTVSQRNWVEQHELFR